MSSSAALTNTNIPHFRTLLQEWEQKQTPPRGFASTLDDIARNSQEHLQSKGGGITDGDGEEVGSKDVTVAFRTRPPLENEAADKFVSPGQEEAEGDPLEFCEGITVVSEEPGVFVAHVPGVKWNGPTLQHKSFEADLAFGPAIPNEEVYQRTVVANDLLPLVLSGGISCILAYGQTGSGKTFTMEGLEHRIARDLFAVAKIMSKRFLEAERGSGVGGEEVAAGEEEGTIFEFGATFLELLGKHAADLVEQPEGVDGRGEPVRKEIGIHEDKAGDVQPRLISTPVRSSEDLEELINRSLSHRRTSATLRNATSSRSHAVLTIRVKNTLMPYAQEGQLILVDLAGSERYEDSRAHDKQRMDESRENNKSLMNLKECVRAKAKMAAEEGFVHIPWRMNKLTMLLKPIFDVESRQHSKTVIIAHVSPHLQDTAHSVNTLSYASPFKTAPPKRRGIAPYDPTDPRTWNHEQTVSWLKDEFIRRASDGKPLNPDEPVEPIVDVEKLCPGVMTARNFAKMYTAEFVERCLFAAAKTGEGAVAVDRLKVVSAEVAGQLYYLVLSAKTRTRNAIMKSRKKIAVEETYGDSPLRKYNLGGVYTNEELLRAQRALGSELWNWRINKAADKAKNEGNDETAAVNDAAKALMDEWKEKGEPNFQEYSEDEILEATMDIGFDKWKERVNGAMNVAIMNKTDVRWALNSTIKEMMDAWRIEKKGEQEQPQTANAVAVQA